MFIFLNHGEKWEWWFGKTPSLKKRVYDMTRMCCAFGHSRVFQVRKGVMYSYAEDSEIQINISQGRLR